MVSLCMASILPLRHDGRKSRQPVRRPLRQSCPFRIAVSSLVPATHNEAPVAWFDPETESVQFAVALADGAHVSSQPARPVKFGVRNETAAPVHPTVAVTDTVLRTMLVDATVTCEQR